MGTEIFEIGSVSARGQIAIPSGIRRELGLEEGSRILFLLENDLLLMKKVTAGSFASITKPLREAARKAGMKEKDVPALVRKFRKEKR